MQHKLFFQLSVSELEKSKESKEPTNSNDKENKTMTNKPNFLKNLDLSKYKRIAGKRTSKLPSNHKKSTAFNSICNWISKGIWTASLAFSSNFCFAANSSDGYQFTGALFSIMNELKGTPIILITAIGIILGGFIWVFKGHDIGLKQVISALIGGGLVLAAPTMVTMIPGMSGAVI